MMRMLGFVSLLPLVAAQFSSQLSNVTQAFNKSAVVPDVLPSFHPTALANMTFTDPSTMQFTNVTPGALLTMAQTATEPTFFLISNNSAAIANQPFVLAIVDPDAPTPQNTSISQFLHFLGSDFHVNGTVLSNSSAAVMDFFPPTPPAGSPPHRYVLAVYNQPANFNSTVGSFVNASTPRQNFNLTVFASRAGLGDPVAGNFFLVGPSNTTSSSGAPSPTQTGTSGAIRGSCDVLRVLATATTSLLLSMIL